MTTGIDDKILKKLETLEKKESLLSRPLEFYRKLLSIQSAVKQRIKAPEIRLNQETAKERLKSGSPLLEHKDFSIDTALLEDAFKEVSALFSSYFKEWAEIALNLQPNPKILTEIAELWFKGEKLPLPGKHDDATEALWELAIHAATKPFLVRHREVLYHLIPQESWRRGYCPFCGGHADFAYLDKERGARWLLCSRCDAEWLFQRLECPFCGAKNQNAIAYFTDDKGLYRLYVCEECRHYVKAIDLRQTEEEILLPLERLLTTDIDIQAQENGYTPLTRATELIETKQNDATLLVKEET